MRDARRARLPIGFAIVFAVLLQMSGCGTADSVSTTPKSNPDQRPTQIRPSVHRDQTQPPHHSEHQAKPPQVHKSRQMPSTRSEAKVGGAPSTSKIRRQPNRCTRQFSPQECARIAEIASNPGSTDERSVPPEHCPRDLNRQSCAELSSAGDPGTGADTAVPNECPPTWPQSQCREVEEAFGEHAE